MHSFVRPASSRKMTADAAQIDNLCHFRIPDCCRQRFADLILKGAIVFGCGTGWNHCEDRIDAAECTGQKLCVFQRSYVTFCAFLNQRLQARVATPDCAYLMSATE